MADKLRNVPGTFADDFPELYGRGAGNDAAQELNFVVTNLNKLIDDNPNVTPDVQRQLVADWCKRNRYELCQDVHRIRVYIASAVAPELDQWVDADWPKRGLRTVDDDWRA